MTVKDDVRAEILKASLDLMNTGGLGALSMREVARRAGASVCTLLWFLFNRSVESSQRIDMELGSMDG